MSFLLEMMKLGLANLHRHMLRSILTALGIILGVAAVITMVSIGEGSKQEALAQLERLGAKNIIIRSMRPPESQQQQGGQQRSFMLRFGLTRQTFNVLKANFPEAEHIVPVKAVGSQVLRADRRTTSQAFGTVPELATAANLRVARGRYLSPQDLEEQALVCVIGHEVARVFFPDEDPLGNTLRIDRTVLRVIGVMSPVGLSGGAGASLIGRDLNLDIHLPITTANVVFGDRVFRSESGSRQASEVEITEVYLVAPTRDEVLQYAQLIERVLMVRHPQMRDVSMIVPYELLENARKSAMTWKLVLSAIASISLLVGGIGIMNIMLASVTERTREIGIRRALGATRKHITLQFLIETGVLSAIGGLIGVGVGIGLSLGIGWGVPRLPDLPYVGSLFSPNISLPTQITSWSIGVAFFVAAATGLVFGIYPALRAAKQDPIVALRHD